MNLVKNTWRTVTIASTAAALALTASPAFAVKPINPPTLHGFCATANPCADNGTNTPTDQNPPVFGFSAGGHDATGDVLIAILVPDNLAQPGSFLISGYASGTASLFSGTAWTSGQLDTFLGFGAQPTNPIGAYLPATQAFQPSADGFWVYLGDLGTITLPANPGDDNHLLTLNQDLGLGGYITAFIKQGDAYGATAPSGAILETSPPVPEPKTWAMMLLGFGAAGVAMRRSRRGKKHVSQLA